MTTYKDPAGKDTESELDVEKVWLGKLYSQMVEMSSGIADSHDEVWFSVEFLFFILLTSNWVSW